MISEDGGRDKLLVRREAIGICGSGGGWRLEMDGGVLEAGKGGGREVAGSGCGEAGGIIVVHCVCRGVCRVRFRWLVVLAVPCGLWCLVFAVSWDWERGVVGVRGS